MRKVLLTTLLLLLPPGLWAQAALRVSSVVGPAEWRPVSAKLFKPLAPAQPVQAGDEVRTGAGAQLILEVPDGSYMVISENSKRDERHSSVRVIIPYRRSATMRN